MSAFNVVRFRVKPGREQDFIDAHRNVRPDFAGFKRGSLIKTGERTFCIIGEWDRFDSLAAARPKMVALLDSFRDTLEDLGGGPWADRPGVRRDGPRTQVSGRAGPLATCSGHRARMCMCSTCIMMEALNGDCK